MINRTKALLDLIEFRESLADLHAALAGFTWDCDRELVQLEERHLVAVLRGYLAGTTSRQAVEDWANLIECRDDIDYEEVEEVLNILANPAITYELTPEVATSLINRLIEG